MFLWQDAQAPSLAQAQIANEASSVTVCPRRLSSGTLHLSGYNCLGELGFNFHFSVGIWFFFKI